MAASVKILGYSGIMCRVLNSKQTDVGLPQRDCVTLYPGRHPHKEF
jgi:hypothetical protein